ncbi:hypothetical protein HG530_000561 [Fusarium avenaceum]|nr:hypothetical protein HG530_000561 [Fusarium avenaceum]
MLGPSRGSKGGRTAELLSRNYKRREVVCQHVDKSRDILELRGEASANNVIGGSHALHDVARDVSVNIIGDQEQGLARLQCDKVEEEEHKASNVVTKLAVCSLDKFSKLLPRCSSNTTTSEVSALLLGLLDQLGHLLSNVLCR